MDEVGSTSRKAGSVLRFEINERVTPVFDAESFGLVGQYERLTGSAICDLDPVHPLNRDIANLEHAPRGPDGCVQYRVDTCILKPIDLDRGNGWLFYEVVNRGTKRALQRINSARANNLPMSREDIGTGFLLERGFAIAWSGWQGDLVREPGRMIADLPVASLPGGPITRVCREEFILDARNVVREDINEPIVEISESVFIAPLHYPAADLDEGNGTLTVRRLEADRRETSADLGWKYVDPTHIEITKPPGLDRGAIYEFIYTARDPIVLGAGIAGIRDINSFLRYETHDQAGNPNPLLTSDGRPLRRAMAFGLSQSGRVLRESLYLGMNEDSQGRQVFDGMITVVTGSRRSVIANPFVHITRYSRQHEDHLYPGDQFPFSYASMHDPISGKTESLLDRANEKNVCPKILHVDTESEIWSGRGSLTVTDCEGADVTLPDNVRMYLANGLPHGPFKTPEILSEQKPNLLSYHFLTRALVAAMTRWIDEGIAPPESRYPSRAAGTLVSIEEVRAAFPKIPGVNFPKQLNGLRVRDFATEPPTEGASYPVFLAAVDRDGNGLGGVRHPLVSVPVGTHLGWQIRTEGYAAGELYSLMGGYIPFAQTAAERQGKGDPRLSLEERYPSKQAWSLMLRKAAEELVAAGLLLNEEVARLEKAALQSWTIFDAI